MRFCLLRGHFSGRKLTDMVNKKHNIVSDSVVMFCNITTTSLSTNAINSLPKVMKICYSQLSDQKYSAKILIFLFSYNRFKMSQQSRYP